MSNSYERHKESLLKHKKECICGDSYNDDYIHLRHCPCYQKEKGDIVGREDKVATNCNCGMDLRTRGVHLSSCPRSGNYRKEAIDIHQKETFREADEDE